MRLNPDCVRDILLYIEDNEDSLFYADKPFLDYDFKVFAYHVKQCNGAGLLLGYKEFIDDSIYIEDLGILGHQFLAEMRDNKTWKKFLKTAGAIALSTVTGVVTAVIESEINRCR